MRTLPLVPLVTLLVSLANSIAAQEPQGIVTGAAAAYRMRPGDVLEIRVWGREEFSGRFQVDENWQIQYPVLGDIDLQDLTVAQVRDSLRAGLEAIFRSPFVTVTPLFRMAVLGEVRSAGLYTVDPTLSIIDVVALAGGPTSEGNMNKIRLLRSGEESRVSFEEESVRGRTLAEIGVRSGDEIIVPRKWLTREDLLVLLSLLQVGLSIAILINTF